MWLYICCCRIFFILLILNNATGSNNRSKKEQQAQESAFSDVIKNISRVNNVLQELIQNYEHLQKIYKSQENLEKDYSSDGEVDEVFKSKMEKKGRNIDPVTEKSADFPATQMPWFEEEEEAESSEKESVEKKENKVEAETTTKKTENLVMEPTPSSLSEEDTSTEEVIEKHKSNKPEAKKLDMPKSEIVFVTQKKTDKNKAKSHKPSKPKEPRIKTESQPLTDKPKFRYTKANKTETKDNKVKDSNSKADRKIKKIIYEEKFSPKHIWDEIKNNKPIKLTRKDISDDSDRNRLSMRSRKGPKTAIVILTKNKKKNAEIQENISESSGDDDIKKDLFKTKVLRQAYGDACLKVTIKKCYKACKAASKTVCRRYKCKSKFKDKFKELVKTACLKEFQPAKTGNAKDSSGDKNKSTGDGDKSSDDDSDSDGDGKNNQTIYRVKAHSHNSYGFVDATRDGYLSPACFPAINPEIEHISLRNDTPWINKYTNQKPNTQINILRDRFERACQKASAKKCKSSCRNSYKDACVSSDCSKSMKKLFKKTCTKECKNSFGGTSSKKSSSTSSSTASSSTETDTSSTSTD